MNVSKKYKNSISVKLINPINFAIIKKMQNSNFVVSLKKKLLTFKFNEIDIKKIKSDKDLMNLSEINEFVHKVETIKNYGIKNGRRIYKNFNGERKILNRKKKVANRPGYQAYFKEFTNRKINKLDDKELNKIICSDSLKYLKLLPENCVDIIITSPPYNFGIDYNYHDDTKKWNDYFKKMFQIFDECIRILKPGGRFIINVQPMYSDYIPTHHIISDYLFKAGLIWKTEILWEKNNYNCKYTSWGSWKSCSNPYMKYTWEYIEVFCKNDLKKNKELGKLSDITADEFKKLVVARWSIAPERRMKEFKNPAMFPEKLVENCLKLFSYVNDIVLDPFNGSGTTTYVAYKLNRKYIGIDIDKEYCKIAKNRIKGKYEKQQ